MFAFADPGNSFGSGPKRIDVPKLRKIDPSLSELTDRQLTELIDCFYDLAEFAFDLWWKTKGSKNPVGSFHTGEQDDKL